MFVSMMCFIFYSIIKSVVKDPERVEDVVPLVLKGFFGFFLTIGYSFTAGISAVLPLKEKKEGLRHMMYLFGLNSFQYFFGMLLADFIINLIPNVIACCLLFAFEDIMLSENVWEFFVVFAMFATCMTCFSYLFSHVFSDPDTGVKYISLLFSLGLFIGPIVVTSIIAALLGERQSFIDGFTFWFSFSPLVTFSLITQNICYKGVEGKNIRPFKVSGGQVADTPLSVMVFSAQILVVFTLVVLIDMTLRAIYKRQGGKEG